MTSKQRDVAFVRWSGEIRRESRDFASLDNITSRVMADPEVCDDDALRSMIQGIIQQRRDEIDQNLRYDKVATESAPARAPQRTGSASITVAPRPAPVAPVADVEHVRATFDRLALALCESLERRNEPETQAAFKRMQAFQQKNPSVIPGTVLVEYTQKLGKLRAHLKHLEDQIAPLTQRAVAASKNGNEQDLARATLRLTAIHAAHPTLLGEAGLEEIRRTVLKAADEKHEHQATARRLLERQRAITGEIKKLAAAVHEFYDVTCTVPGTSEEIQEAETNYQETIKQVLSHDTAWFTDIVLEMADLLAEWNLPPLGAESQIDRFLDGITAGLGNIRKEMCQIKNHQNGHDPAQADRSALDRS